MLSANGAPFLSPLASHQITPNVDPQAPTSALERLHDWGFTLTEDIEKFNMADQLLNRGHQLPELHIPENFYCHKSEFFNHLATSCVDLFIYLRKNPASINALDENGMTILHHAAMTSVTRGPDYASIIHQLLFDMPGVDFSIQDNNDNTPVHIAAIGCSDMKTCQLVFPNFVMQAIAHGFDCCIKGERGLTILHLSAIIFYSNWETGREQNLANILRILIEQNIPNLPLVINALSDSGSTALYYSINRASFDEAKMLLDAGADPALYGSKQRDPLLKLRERLKHIYEYREKLISEYNPEEVDAEEVDAEQESIHLANIARLNEQIDKMNDLEVQMEKIIQEQKQNQ